MKKNLLLLVFATIVSLPALSQGWRIAPAVGLNASYVSYSSGLRNSVKAADVDLSSGVRARGQVGAYIDRFISDGLSIRAGLLYTGKGGRVTLTSTQNSAVSAQSDFQFNYLEVPLLVNIGIGDNGLRLMGGPVLGLALSGKSITQGRSSGVVLSSETTKLSIGNSEDDDFRPTDLSVSLGLAKQLELGDSALEIGLHVQPSFSRFTPESAGFPDNFARHLMVGLRVVYLFEIGR